MKGLRKPGRNPCKGLRGRRSTFQARYLQPAKYRRLFHALDVRAADHPADVALIRLPFRFIEPSRP